MPPLEWRETKGTSLMRCRGHGAWPNAGPASPTPAGCHLGEAFSDTHAGTVAEGGSRQTVAAAA